MNRDLKKLENARNKYNATIDEVMESISDKVNFEFYIFYQPSDGFVMLATETSHNAHLLSCLEHINKYGVLTFDDYMQYTI